MAGAIEVMPSSTKNAGADLRMLGDEYVAADGDRNNEEPRSENLIPKNIHEIKCPDISSATRTKPTNTKNEKKGVSVATKVGSFTRQRMDLLCSQAPNDTNSAVGVDVSCGAMNAFSRDVPYNSAGLSLVGSLDTNPGGFSSQNTRRRRRPTLISSMTSSPPHTIRDVDTVERRLRASDINIPTRRRRAPRVERFNYAKALLRSDHELEKLSRKIRSEINESELFELAQAAQKAADLGVDNFSGRASTFGELDQQRHEELKDAKTGSLVIGKRKPVIGDDTTKRSSPTQMPRLSRSKPREFDARENNDNEIDNGGPKVIGFPEQSLLDHARAAAAAVVVATPAVQIRASTLKEIRKEPGKRSMRIDSLRDVNEVIPQWKELHGHMRTHFYRANVESDSLFFRELEFSPKRSTRNNISPNTSVDAKETRNSKDHRRSKSFFDLLPGFRTKQSPQRKDLSSQSDDDGDTDGSKSGNRQESDNQEPGEFGTILSSHISPKKKDFGKIQSPGLCVPPGLAHPDECKNLICESPGAGGSSNLENGGYGQGQATSLTPRLPKSPDSFDLEVFHKKMSSSSELPNGSQDVDEYDDDDSDDDDNHNNAIPSGKNSSRGSPIDHQHRCIDTESITSSPKENRESSTESIGDDSVCPLSPSNDSILHQSSPRFSSPTTPSTPKNRVIPRRKDSGFSTPAHLRMIKRIHSSVSDENRSNSDGFLEQSKTENLQDNGLRDKEYASTPATGAYSQFEPNSIVQNSPERSQDILAASPSLQHTETNFLALPTIQSSKSANEIQKGSRNFVRRKIRTQSQNGMVRPSDPPTTPTDSMSKTLMNNSEGSIDFASEKSPSATGLELSGEALDDTINDDSKALSSSKIISYIDPPHDASAPRLPREKPSRMVDNVSEKSIREIQYGKAVDEKKECDGDASSVNLNRHSEIDIDQSMNPEHLQYIPNFSALRSEKKIEGQARKSPSTDTKGESTSLQEKTNDDFERPAPHENEFVLSLRKRIEKPKLTPRTKAQERYSAAATTDIETIGSNRTAESKDILSTCSIRKDDGPNQACDTRIGENLSVCHSLPPTEVSFKTAVQTVQGVAVQTVQEVFSHLSLGSPRKQIQSKEWQSEADNKEFLSNYFYCAKAVMGNQLRRASENQGNVDGFNPSETDLEGLVCTEPCNGKDLRCYLFGIDTMCGGLIDLLPREVNSNSDQRRQDINGALAHTPTRDRSSSISMGQINRSSRQAHTGVNSYQVQEEGTWLGAFQRVASERLNLQFQAEENELEKSRHPYTPPCLSRKLQTPSQTL